ncbi:MAG: hypothetical protein R6U13_09120 [Desulfatiglandaceae bacterium]
MTHSLHRRGDRDSLSRDFVVLGCPATGVNKKGSRPKTQQFLSVCHKHGCVNLGDMKTGNIYTTTMDNILDRVSDGTIVECTFDNKDKVVALIKEFAKNKPGISIIISGITDVVQEIMNEAGLGYIHSLEYSLGTWGQTDRLPDFEILELTTMCGHGMIAENLIDKNVRDLKRGRKTLDEAVLDVTKCCTCGNLNLTRARELFKKILPLYTINSLYQN